jgi:hypothetical protein
MSAENLEFVKSLQPRPSFDLVEAFDSRWPRVRTFFEPRSHPDLESGFVQAGERTSHRGLDGFRQTWLDWLEPWDSYRTEMVRFIDCGDDVLVFVRDYGRRRGMSAEVKLLGGAVWTVRDGKLARAFFYTAREDALNELGLSTAILDSE